jgi:hypothetical protein
MKSPLQAPVQIKCLESLPCAKQHFLQSDIKLLFSRRRTNRKTHSDTEKKYALPFFDKKYCWSKTTRISTGAMNNTRLSTNEKPVDSMEWFKTIDSNHTTSVEKETSANSH